MVLKVSLNTGINRIRLEFKGTAVTGTAVTGTGINRIRLEFKDNTGKGRPSCAGWINRIRLEFKAVYRILFRFRKPGLIESDWNLKKVIATKRQKQQSGLIESDWNLKGF